MGKKKPAERDAKGDVKFDMGKADWEKIRRSQYTYIFHYYDEKKAHYFPYFGLFSSADERMEKAKEDPVFFEKELYWTPDHPPYNFFIRYHNQQLAMQVEFFKEVFEERAFVEGYHPSHKYYRLILPKPKYEEIINCINEYGLLPVRDLLLEVIAIGQNKYVEEISFWEQPERQKLVSTAEQETGKVVQIIEKLDSGKWMRGEKDAKPPSELQYINFVFNDETIRVEHEWLAREFVEHFKSYYNNLHYKNWKKDLLRYPDRFEDNIKKQQFKYNLAKSFYNLVTKAGLFPLEKDKPTPNRLMECIAKLLEFCLIRVAGPDEIDSVKAKNVRNWITRKELEPALTYAEIKPEKTRLLKYFDEEFINITDDVMRADAITVGYYLSERFDITHLVNDLIYISQALREYGSYIGHQLIGEGRPFEPTFPEFKAFSGLINGVKGRKKITSIKYTVEGDETEYTLTQRLPLYLIEEALKEYADDQQVEFDTEPVRTSVTRPEPGAFNISKADHFLQPEQRFMVRFVKAFYEYLLAEAPPANEWDSMPSERYYALIANILQNSWFFYHQRHPEWFIIEKVKQWHKMDTDKENLH